MQKVLEIMQKWGYRKDCVIEMMHDIQTEYNYLPEHALRLLAARLGVPLTQITHMATFYNAFSLKPKGKYKIEVCIGTSCYAKGADKILEALSRELRIQPGETTPDMEFTLESVHCLGCCGLAPVLIVNGKEVYGHQNPTKMKRFIRQLKERDKRA